MKARKYVFQTTAVVLLGEAICCAVMVGIFALAGYFSVPVILGALAGGLLAVGNFFIMALCADMAADKGEQQDVRGGQALIQMSYIGRLIGLFLILIVCAKTGIFNLLALVLPLVFVRPVLTVSELIKKKGGIAQ